MRVSGWAVHLATRALAESMDIRSMIHLVRRLIRNYDIYERTGFSDKMSIPNKDAAAQIVRDMRDSELLLEFIIMLIDVHQNGMAGKKYRIPYLREIVNEIEKSGLIYDQESRLFFEDPRVRRTINWGVLRELEEYIFTFVRLDIVGNTNLVRQNPEEVIQTTYSDLRSIVQTAIEKRNGRIWNWEGDGGLAAFYFSNRSIHAVLSAMEIIHELYIYNLLGCRLNKPLRVRIAVHSGPCQFRHNFEDIKSDTIKKIMELESKYTRPDSITVSKSVFHMLNQTLEERLQPTNYGENTTCYSYQLKWES